jgi:long-subunit fatty acid transport protein
MQMEEILMNSKIQNLLCGASLLVTASAANAGGLDRAVFNPDILFEKGNYVKLTFSHTNPDVAPTAAPGRSVASRFNNARLEYKHQFTDAFSVAVILNNDPIGADIDYTGLGTQLIGRVDATAASVIGKYNINDNFSVFGGLKYQTVEAFADLTAVGGAALNFGSESELGFIAGVAYERKDIALRVSLSYESRIDFALPTSAAAGGGVIGSTTAATPAAYTLNFQTGVAPKVLVFGSIRHAQWSDANIVLPTALGGTQLSNFSDTTNYTLGVGYKVSDQWSVVGALNYEPTTSSVISPFAPTNGIRGVSLGAKYSRDNYDISFGVRYSERGDVVTTIGTPFSDSTVVTTGISFGYRF